MRRAFRSLCWGFHAPGGAVLWWLIKQTGHLHILGELLFEQMGEHDVAAAMREKDAALGLGLDAEGLVRHLEIPRVAYTVGDPRVVAPMIESDGFQGETIGDRFRREGLVIVPADDDLLNGWQRCQALLQSDPAGVPWLTVDPSCRELVQAIPAGLQDSGDPDDVQRAAPVLVAFRYGAMSRPTPSARLVPAAKMPADCPAAVMATLRRQRSGTRSFGETR